LKPESRCRVSANSFSEYASAPNPETKKKDVAWFALNDDRPFFAFAGICTEFKGDRGTKSKPIPGPHLVYGFLTTAPNAIVEPIHPKAMPVILTTDEVRDVWTRARGMRRKRCNGRWRMTLRAVPTRKTSPRRRESRWPLGMEWEDAKSEHVGRRYSVVLSPKKREISPTLAGACDKTDKREAS
jgi:putative SOS response-associated peptidase YedK